MACRPGGAPQPDSAHDTCSYLCSTQPGSLGVLSCLLCTETPNNPHPSRSREFHPMGVTAQTRQTPAERASQGRCCRKHALLESLVHLCPGLLSSRMYWVREEGAVSCRPAPPTHCLPGRSTISAPQASLGLGLGTRIQLPLAPAFRRGPGFSSALSFLGGAGLRMGGRGACGGLCPGVECRLPGRLSQPSCTRAGWVWGALT